MSIAKLLENYKQSWLRTDSQKKAFRRRRKVIECISEVASFIPGDETDEQKTRIAICTLDSVRKSKKWGFNHFQGSRSNQIQIINAARESLNISRGLSLTPIDNDYEFQHLKF